VTRQRLFTTFKYIDRAAEQANKRIPTPELNKLMEQIRGAGLPAVHKGRQAKILYAAQVSVKPTKFVLFVNQKRLFHFSYLRFIENRLRETFGFEGVPIQLELREEQKERSRR
jgi:GTPase